MRVEKKYSRKSRHIFPQGFTISEVLICVVVILILATLAMAGYTQVMDNAYQRICSTNQTIIMKGIERHFLTTGIAPATLGDIKLEYWKNAYAEVMKDRDWQTKLSYFLVKVTTAKEACADITKLEDLVNPAEMKVYGMMPDVFHCPADRTSGSPSYGINAALKNYSRWKDVPADMTILGDTDRSTFSSEDELSYRHKRRFAQEQVAQVLTKSMCIDKKKKEKNFVSITGGASSSAYTDASTNQQEERSRIEQKIAELRLKIEEYERRLQDENLPLWQKIEYEGKIIAIKVEIGILEFWK
ncbi:MAG: prepilin-type N-terminal cleavage/methylation domain-containing protein [Candidatus Omnitrophota bacterium]